MPLFRCFMMCTMRRIISFGFIICLVAASLAVAAQGIYYEPDIRDIIRKDCARCHSGTIRNLMSGDSVRMYVDNGMLSAMIQGPMRQFAGPSDANTIQSWIDAGAPENQPRKTTTAKQAAFSTTSQSIYYEPDIRDIIRRDCAMCHSGAMRNLMSSDSVRMYVDNGMLSTMIQGPMRQHAGTADANTIQAWIDAGAPEHAPSKTTTAKAAAFASPAQSNAISPVQTRLTFAMGIQGMMAKDCLRCHQGPFRKLTSYEEVKVYVDNGLLGAMVQPSGPMNRFAGADAQPLLTWIRDGAPK